MDFAIYVTFFQLNISMRCLCYIAFKKVVQAQVYSITKIVVTLFPRRNINAKV